MSTQECEQNGTVWDVWPDDATPPTPWSFDPRDGTIQGPLDLGSFNDGGLLLQLAPGQTALLACHNAVRSTWFEGSHRLRIGTGPGQIPSDGRLFMIATTVGLDCRWGDAIPPATAARSDALRGSCTFHIASPTVFYNTFLKHAETTGEAFIRRLLGTLMQSRLEERLSAIADRTRTPRQLLSDLRAEDLADGWQELGVALTAFACDQAAPSRSAEISRPAGQPAPARV